MLLLLLVACRLNAWRFEHDNEALVVRYEAVLWHAENEVVEEGGAHLLVVGNDLEVATVAQPLVHAMHSVVSEQLQHSFFCLFTIYLAFI